MSRLICLGLVVKDLVFRVHAIPYSPQKLAANSLRVQFGGMAATAAAAAAALGGDVEFWGRVGDDDAGREAEHALKQQGVVPHVRPTTGAATPTSAVIVDDRGERMLAVYKSTLDPDPGWLPLERLAGAGAVHADFRWPQGAAALYEAAAAQGIARVLDADAGEAQELQALLPLANHVVFSEQGLLSCAGDKPPEEALRSIACAPGKVLGVTLGERGSLFLHEGQLQAFAAPLIQARDTNGAGDVFHGAYALALARGLPWPEAVRYATTAASLKCTRDNGWDRLPHHDEVLAFSLDVDGNSKASVPWTSA